MKDLQLSRLGLGTVQWGMRYGIANVTGQPGIDDVKTLLRRAADAGINALDTARGYAASETVIGGALADLGLADRFVVVSKVDYRTGDPDAEVTASVHKSLAELRLPRLHGCLAHYAESALNPRVWAAFLRQRDAGRVLHVGVSVSENPVAMLEEAMRLEGLTVVQVALNVFDTRLVRSGILAELQRRHIAVFARSAFLKGLIALDEDRVPAAMADVLPAKRRLRALAAARGRDLLEFALQYPLSVPGVDCLLVGCETPAQLEQNLAWANAPRLGADDLAGVADLAADLPAWITQPWQWPVEKWKS